MELIKISEENGKQAVSARELYNFLEATERFSNWIERQFQYGFIEDIDYVGCKEFNTLANQDLMNYALTIDCAKEISMLQKSEKGKQARQYFIECEKRLNQFQLPQTFAQALQLAADQAKQIELQQSQIKELQPKAEVYDKIIDSTNLKSISEVGKVTGLGQKKLFEFLRKEQILMKNNLPYQRFIDEGYFEVKSHYIQGLNNNHSQTFVTSKGESYVCKIISDGRVKK